MRTAFRSSNDAGFALLEVLITAGLVVTVAAGSAHMLSIATRAVHSARVRSIGSMLAAEKIEQLRSLAWTHTTTADPAISISSSDFTSDLSTNPATDTGPGLLPSPPGTLNANVPYYVDYLDGAGRTVGGGSPPAAAVFIRRWSVRRLTSDPDNILILSVVVTTRAPGATLAADAVRLVTVVARK